jgi:hypothetical protein
LLVGSTACLPVPGTEAPAGPRVTYNPFATFTSTPFEPVADTPIPSLTQTAETRARPRYQLEAVLDYASRTLSVDETIEYPNVTGLSLETLILAVEPNHWQDCFFLDSLEVDGQPVDHRLNGHTLELNLTAPLDPGAEAVVHLVFHLDLPGTDITRVFGAKTDQINLVDWYPFIVPYQDGWVLHEPSLVGEHLVYASADLEAVLEVTPAMPIACSAPLVGGTYQVENARNLTFSVSPHYQSMTLVQDGVEITSYYFADDRLSAEAVLMESAQAMKRFAALWDVYPHAALSIVEADFHDGMEYDGLYFLGRIFYKNYDGTKLDYLIDLAVHETAHQWWYGKTGSDQALEPWLDEALSTYSEYLFYETYYPGVAETWWTFRVDSHIPAGDVSSSIYTSLDVVTYTRSVYLRGAQFLRDLRARMGDEAFFGFLGDYSEQTAGRIAQADDFFRILAAHASDDLGTLIEAYFP